MENEGNNYTNCNWCVWNSNYTITKGTVGLGSWWGSGEHPNYYIIDNGKNTEKSPEDLRRLAHSDSSEKLSANADVKNSNE